MLYPDQNTNKEIRNKSKILNCKLGVISLFQCTAAQD